MAAEKPAAACRRDLFAEVTEQDWDNQLFNSRTGLAAMLGWSRVYHTFRSERSPSGFPDRVLVRERVIFAELKRETGKPSPTQRDWLDSLVKAGAETYLWRPSDLEEVGKILTARGRPTKPFACAWLAS